MGNTQLGSYEVRRMPEASDVAVGGSIDLDKMAKTLEVTGSGYDHKNWEKRKKFSEEMEDQGVNIPWKGRVGERAHEEVAEILKKTEHGEQADFSKWHADNGIKTDDVTAEEDDADEAPKKSSWF